MPLIPPIGLEKRCISLIDSEAGLVTNQVVYLNRGFCSWSLRCRHGSIGFCPFCSGAYAVPAATPFSTPPTPRGVARGERSRGHHGAPVLIPPRPLRRGHSQNSDSRFGSSGRGFLAGVFFGGTLAAPPFSSSSGWGPRCGARARRQASLQRVFCTESKKWAGVFAQERVGIRWVVPRETNRTVAKNAHVHFERTSVRGA